MTALEPNPVLVVGPDKSLQKAIRKVLPDVDLTFVADGKAALLQLKNRPPELLLLDTALPKLDGYEVLSQLRLRESLSDVLVVLYTSRTAAEADSAESTLVARDDLPTLLVRVKKMLAEQKMRRAFGREYWQVLSDATKGAADLTRDERSVLQSADFPIDGEVNSSPLATRAAKYDAIVASSLTTKQAAKKLGVNASRIRQRLLANPPQLYGIRRDNAWWLPKFQFGSKGLVPHIAEVIAHLDPQLDPVAVDAWFRTPHVDLEDGDRTLSPLQWLAEGRKVAAVVQLADDL
jgi:CheY-like chemotaxis protein